MCIRDSPKSDYDYHTEAMDRAQTGGIDDVGMGVLFGLELYRYEFAGLLMHAEHLEAVFGVGPHLSLIHIWDPAGEKNSGLSPEKGTALADTRHDCAERL